MRYASASYLADHLVEPKSLRALTSVGDELRSPTRTFPWVSRVPVFSELYPSQQWQDELKQTAGFMANYVGSPKQIAASSWVKQWPNDETVEEDSRIVCVGGSFVDDVPHVTKGHKFNVDLFSHSYIDLLDSVIAAQDTTFISCWAEHLPYESNSVHFVYSRNALDHFSNPAQAAIEMHRILKPGGKLCIGVYYNSSFVDAHETGVVDDEFLKKVIFPLFELRYLNMVDAPPTAAVFKDVRTSFLHFVADKLTAVSPIKPIDMEGHGALTESSKVLSMHAKHIRATLRRRCIYGRYNSRHCLSRTYGGNSTVAWIY